MPSAAPLIAAEPTFELAGNRQSRLEAGLLRLEVHERTDGLYRLEAKVGNWGAGSGGVDYLYFGGLLDFGQLVKIRLGDQILFEGRISALEAEFPQEQAATLTLLAEDRLQDLRMTRRTRSFAEVTDADLLRRIAADHGLTPQVSVTGPVYRLLAQVNQSDLAFLRDRARLSGYELWVSGMTLYARPRSERSRAPLELTYPGKLHEFTVLADLAGQSSRVVVSGWDVDGKQGIREAAGESAVSSELRQGRSGASVLARAFAERTQTVAHQVPFTGNEARAYAESMYRAQARRFVVGQGRADPDERLRVGGSLNLKGLGPLFSGVYSVTESIYRFDRVLGSRTDFTAERPGLGNFT